MTQNAPKPDDFNAKISQIDRKSAISLQRGQFNPKF